MDKAILAFAAGLLLIAGAPGGIAAAPPHAAISRGKFLVDYGGCNDCHTPGWDEHDGHAPADKLLTGGGFNFQGP